MATDAALLHDALWLIRQPYGWLLPLLLLVSLVTFAFMVADATWNELLDWRRRRAMRRHQTAQSQRPQFPDPVPVRPFTLPAAKGFSRTRVHAAAQKGRE